MSVVKVIELLAEGDSVESAVEAAVAEASKTIRNIKNVYVQDIQAVIEGTKVSKFRLNVKVSFVVG